MACRACWLRALIFIAARCLTLGATWKVAHRKAAADGPRQASPAAATRTGPPATLT